MNHFPSYLIAVQKLPSERDLDQILSRSGFSRIKEFAFQRSLPYDMSHRACIVRIGGNLFSGRWGGVRGGEAEEIDPGDEVTKGMASLSFRKVVLPISSWAVNC
jgi:hypothetical protein